MHSIPSWAIFGLLAAWFSTTQMLLQERFKTSPLPMAFWSKVACAVIMIPFVVANGLPTNPFYYFLLAAQSLLWVISDVIFYRSINETGASVISRVLPIATIISFFLWFAIDWPLAISYTARPAYSASIITVLCLLAFFVWRLKDCPVTGKALRSVWFVLFACVVGAVSTKYITQQADISKGVYAFVFGEAVIMIAMWLIYYVIKRPVPADIMFGLPSIKSGLLVGAAAALAVTFSIYAIYNVDNPAYVSAVKYLDTVLILIFYRVAGRPVKGRVWAGLGIVACAAALVVLKSGG